MLFVLLFVYTLPPGATSFSISWFCCHVLYYPPIENAHKNSCQPCTFLDFSTISILQWKTLSGKFSPKVVLWDLGLGPRQQNKSPTLWISAVIPKYLQQLLATFPLQMTGKAKHPSWNDGTDLHCRSIWLAVRATACNEQRAAACVGGAKRMHFPVSCTAPAAAPGKAAPHSEMYHKPGSQHSQKQLFYCCAWQNCVNIIYWWQISKCSKTNGAQANLQSCMFFQGKCGQVTSSFEARETEKLNQ